jgi:hypothetical protein
VYGRRLAPFVPVPREGSGNREAHNGAAPVQGRAEHGEKAGVERLLELQGASRLNLFGKGNLHSRKKSAGV